MTRHTLKWFKNREGHVIFRRPSETCFCDMCKNGTVFVRKASKKDGDHAAYLKLCQDELGLEYFSRPIKD